MLYITFCYAKDEAMLRMASARILELDPAAVIYAVNDPAAPIKGSIPGVHLQQGDFDRGGNLNGLQAVAGELLTFERLLQQTGAQWLVKFDCDLWANDLTPFLATGPGAPDYLSVERAEAFKPSGLIYRLSRHMVRELIKLYNARTQARQWALAGYHYPEDVTIYALAQMTRMRCELIPYATGYTAGCGDGGPGANEHCHRAGCVHCGEPLPDGTRATREHCTLRMRILLSESTARRAVLHHPPQGDSSP